jgi:predicted nucleic acid-binding protein
MNYLDTSVIISYYLPEARSAQVNALLQQLSQVVISDKQHVLS